MTKNNLWILVAFLVLAGCKQKKPSLSGDEPVEVGDFIESFELVKPPYQFSDSTLLKKENDSSLISYKVFTQFISDTVLIKAFGKNARPKIYPLCRVELEDRESYLFAKMLWGDKRAGFVLCFDNKNQFAGAMQLLRVDTKAATRQVSGIDRGFSLYKSVFLKKPDGSMVDGREVYVFNGDARQFTLIMTDALEDKVNEVINPIDTLPRKNKYSADYVKDKMNIVSVRDGIKAGKIRFFVHFEKNGGECTGELKGEATLTGPRSAVYQQPGDACVLQFNFTTTSVSLKEIQACGSRRGVKCAFEGVYPRKKEPRKKNPRN